MKTSMMKRCRWFVARHSALLQDDQGTGRGAGIAVRADQGDDRRRTSLWLPHGSRAAGHDQKHLVAHLPAQGQAGTQAGGVRSATRPLPTVGSHRAEPALGYGPCRIQGSRDGWLTVALVIDCHIIWSEARRSHSTPHPRPTTLESRRHGRARQRRKDRRSARLMCSSTLRFNTPVPASFIISSIWPALQNHVRIGSVTYQVNTPTWARSLKTCCSMIKPSRKTSISK